MQSVSERLGVPEKKIVKWVESHKMRKAKIESDELETVLRENQRLKNELERTKKELNLILGIFFKLNSLLKKRKIYDNK